MKASKLAIALTLILPSTVYAFGGNATAFGGAGGDASSTSIAGAAAGSIAGAGAATGPISVTGAPASASTGSLTGTITGGNSSGVGTVNVDASTDIPDVQAFIGGARTPGSNTTAHGRYLDSWNIVGLLGRTTMKPDPFTYGMIMMSSTDAAMRSKGKELMMQGANEVLKKKESTATSRSTSTATATASSTGPFGY